MTALTAYLSINNATTPALANQLLTGANGGSTTTRNSTIGTSTGYGEVVSRGSGAAWAAAGSIGAASGNGFAIDSTVLEGQQTISGNWTPSLRMQTSLGSITADIICRIMRYSGSTGTYTTLATITLAAQSITTTAATYALAATSIGVTSFGAGDKLYVDVWLNITANSTGSGSATIKLIESSSATLGSTSAQIVTPGYQASVSRAIPTKAALLATNSRSVPTSAALLATNTRSIPTLAALLATNTRNIPTLAALAKTLTRSVPTLAALAGSVSPGVSGATSILPFTLPYTLSTPASAPVVAPPLTGPYTAKYAIRVRDSNRNLIGEIDQYVHLTAVLRRNLVSDWQLEIDALHPLAASLATRGNGIIVTRSIYASSGALVYSYDWLSGPVTGWSRSLKDQSLIVRGKDDLVWIARRNAWPVPSATTTGGLAGSAYDTRTGAAESVILAYIAANCVSNASRVVPGLTTATDQGRGATVTGNARFDQLVSKDGTGLLQTLAQAGGINLTVRQNLTSNALVASCSVPRDQTSVCKFSTALANLDDYTYSVDAPDFESGGNLLVVAGGGTGTGRVFDIEQNTASITTWGRAEGFVDARDTTDVPTLQQRGQAALAQLQEQSAFSITLGSNTTMTYGLDYDLGDKVSAVVDGVTIQDTIQQVTVDLSADQAETITPQIGSPGIADILSIFAGYVRQIQRLQAQLSKLQRVQ